MGQQWLAALALSVRLLRERGITLPRQTSHPLPKKGKHCQSPSCKLSWAATCLRQRWHKTWLKLRSCCWFEPSPNGLFYLGRRPPLLTGHADQLLHYKRTCQELRYVWHVREVRSVRVMQRSLSRRTDNARAASHWCPIFPSRCGSLPSHSRRDGDTAPYPPAGTRCSSHLTWTLAGILASVFILRRATYGGWSVRPARNTISSRRLQQWTPMSGEEKRHTVKDIGASLSIIFKVQRFDRWILLKCK